MRKKSPPDDAFAAERQRLETRIHQLVLQSKKNHEGFKNYWAGWQSIAIAFGLTVGGVWTLVTFSETKQREAAQLHLARLQLESIQRREMNAELTLEVLQRRGKRRVVQIGVAIRSAGNAMGIERYTIDPEDCYIQRLGSVSSTGEVEWVPAEPLLYRIASYNIETTGYRFATSELPTREYAVQIVKEPGVYVVQFALKPEKPDGIRLRVHKYFRVD